MSQRGLFDPVLEPPAARGRETSVEAGKQIRGRQNDYRGKVLQAIQSSPKTDQEIAIALSLPENSVRPRRIELERLKQIEDSGTRRPTTSGRRAIVWRVCVPTPAPEQ